MNFIKRIFDLFKQKQETIDPMKYLITGIGNMGPKYVGTRHNIGFEVLDYLAEEAGKEFKNDSLGDLVEIKHKGRTLVLLKPSTFVNLSGKAVRFWMQQKNIKLDNILIILDDMNLPYGKLRLRGKGSSGGHNGLKDIERVLATSNYARLRFGIGSDFSKGRQVDFVLGKWNKSEMDFLLTHIKNCAAAVKSFAAIGLKYTMERYNKK